MTKSYLANQASNSQFSGQSLVLGSTNGKVMSLPPASLFGTDGIRGRVGTQELLNPSLALQIGFWAGQVWQTANNQPAPVILGQDSRNSSDMLSTALSAGLTAAGVEVWNLGLCPTPAVAHLTSTSMAMGGIMISASHNPPEDNGIKFFGAEGTKLSTLVQAQIEAGIRGRWETSNNRVNEFLAWGKQYHRPELLNQYTESLHESLLSTNLAGMQIVLDLAWGAATLKLF